MREREKTLIIIFILFSSGWAMCQHLPTGEFEFVVSWNLEELLETADDADYGYFLEVDIHFPEEVHDKLNDYPPVAEKTSPTQYSPFQKDILQQNLRVSHPNWSDEQIEEGIAKAKTSKKLIASLEDKEKYICHYRLLRKYVELGCQVIILNYS